MSRDRLKFTVIPAVLLLAVLTISGCGQSAPSGSGTGDGSGQTSTSAPAQPKEMTARYESETKEALQLFQSGDYKGAVTAADAVIQQSPHNDQAYSVRGFAKALAGDTAAGLMDTKTAYELNPDNTANYYNMAMVYKLEGRLDEARTWFERVLSAEPGNTWSVYGIATIYADQNHDKEALDWLEKAICLDSAVKGVAAEQDHFYKYHGQPRFEALIK